MEKKFYDFYVNKYELEQLNLYISDKLVVFLIYDEEYYYYLDGNFFLDIDGDLNILDVINKFNDDMNMLLERNLCDISIGSLNVSYVTLSYDMDMDDSSYGMAFLNCIHFPAPNVESISRDLEIIDKSKLLKKNINRKGD